MPVDIIILAAIAIFVVLRLRSTLGQKTGHFPNPETKDAPKEDRVIRLEHPTIDGQKLPDRKELAALLELNAEPDLSSVPESLRATIKEMIAIDKNFAPKSFLEGAHIAFEMILNAYSKHDKIALKPLLSKETYDSFAKDIDEQMAAGEKRESTLLAITSTEFEHVELNKSIARITLHFTSEQNRITKNKSGDVVDGSATDIEVVDDVWTFERDLRAANPNWTLITT